MVLLAAVPAAAATLHAPQHPGLPRLWPVRTFTGPPVTWDALVRYLTGRRAGQDHQAA
jgi:hypothetical protein